MEKLLSKMTCPHKAYLNSLSLKGDVEKTYYISKFIKDLYANNSFKDLMDEKIIRPLVEDLFKDIEFLMKKEEEVTKETLIEHIISFSKDMNSMGAIVVDKNVNVKKKIGVEEIFKKFDLILSFPNNNTLYCCVFHNTHSVAVNKPNDIKAAVEYYLSNEMAKEAFPGKTVMPVSIIFFPKKDLNFSYSNYWKELDMSLVTKFTLPTIIGEVQNVTNSFTTSTGERCGNTFSDCKFCPGKTLCEYFEANTKELNVVNRQKVTGSVMLTRSQEEINNSNPGIYRVLAGAGTGKTTALSNKIVTMVQDGIDPKDILIITFSEKGTTEIKEKLDYWLKEWYITEITSKDFEIYNFNSYGDKVLQDEFQRFGYTAKPTLIDSMRKMEIIKALLDNHSIIEDLDYINPLNPTGALKKVSDYIASITQYMNDPIRKDSVYYTIKTKHPNDYQEINNVIDEYFNYLKQNNLIDYENQTECLVKLCTVGYEDLLVKYAKPHIICDEFQDTNKAQLQFIKACAMLPDFESLTMCGDDSQSIYAWRGADKKIITSLEKEFPNLVDVKMTENFRSTNEIVDLANKFNALDDSIIKKNLISNKQGKPVEMIDSTKLGSAEEAVRIIKNYLANGTNKYDIGVIARRSSELHEISKLLQKADIPVLVSVSEFIKDNPKVKALCDFTKYLLDQEKTLYLAEYLQAKDNEEFEKQASIEKYVGVKNEQFKLELDGLDDNSLVRYFLDKVEEMAKTDRIVEGLYGILKNKTFSNLKEVEDFLSKLRKYEADFLVEKDEQAYDAITLMTAHAAKGREFKVIIGILDNFIEGTEDHQCAFVTITRAMDELVLIQDLSKSGGPRKKNNFFQIISDLLP